MLPLSVSLDEKIQCPIPDQRKYSGKSENIIGLDSYILNSLSYLNLIWIYMSHCMTSLLKLEITV